MVLGDLDIEGLTWSWTVLGVALLVLVAWIGSLLYQIKGHLERQEERDQHFYGEWAAELLLKKADRL